MCNARLVALRDFREFGNQSVQVVFNLEILRFEDRSELGAFGAYSSVHFYQCDSSIAISHKKDGGQAADDFGIEGKECIESTVYTFLAYRERLDVGRCNHVRFVGPCFRRGNVEWRLEVVDIMVVMHSYLMHVQVDDSFDVFDERCSHKSQPLSRAFGGNCQPREGKKKPYAERRPSEHVVATLPIVSQMP